MIVSIVTPSNTPAQRCPLHTAGRCFQLSRCLHQISPHRWDSAWHVQNLQFGWIVLNIYREKFFNHFVFPMEHHN